MTAAAPPATPPVTYVASDWHLGTQSPPEHRLMARAFLQKVAQEGASVVLNGDIFEGLFEPMEAAEAAQPEVLAAMAALQQQGRLRRIVGNHDPAKGEGKVLLSGLPQVGRVLIAHGHAADPWQRNPLCQVGDAISRQFGRAKMVRGAAAFMETLAFTAAGPQILQRFRERCSAWVRREQCDLGVFGHVHNQHLAPNDPYANAGWLRPDALEYLRFDASGAHLGVYSLAEARSSL